MKLLHRYIGLRLIFGWLLVLLILTALFSILELVGQLDDIGEGSYQVRDAFIYVAYTYPGRVLNRDQLLEQAHDRAWDPYDRSIDIRISRLRKKIEADPSKPQIIKTVRGTGYVFSPKAN